MRKLFGLFVGFTILFMAVGCKPATKTDISLVTSSKETSNEINPSDTKMQPSNPPSIPPASPSQPTNTPSQTTNASNEVKADRAKYNLDNLKNELKKQKGIFDITESPNKKFVAYMYSNTNSNYDAMTLHIWRVGNKTPQEAPTKLETVGDVIWSPNSDYVFVDTGTYVLRGGVLYSAEGVKEIASLGYVHTIFFSPNGKNILYSKANRDTKMDTLKSHYMDPGEPFDLMIYDIAANHEEVIEKSSEAIDYSAIGWLDSQTVSYDVTKYSVENDEIQEQSVKYKYDLRSRTSIMDDSQSNQPVSLTNYWKITRGLSGQKDVFGETWSPDQRTLVYAKGNVKEWHGEVWMWRRGEEKPILVYKEQMFNKFAWSPDSRYFMFDDGVSSEEDVHIVDARSGKFDTINSYILIDRESAGVPYFSTDSHYLLFTGIENIQTDYKKNTETGNSHNISIMNMDTKEIKVLFKAIDKIDYIALGWLGEYKIVYEKHDYEKSSYEILEFQLN